MEVDMIREKIETARGRLVLRYFTEQDTQTVYDICGHLPSW